MGDWKRPAYESVFEGYEVHIYDVCNHVFKRKLKVTKLVAPITLKADITYQACTPGFCGPVQTTQASMELKPR